MMTVRNVTQRDGGDHQQPTNLAVQGGVSSVKDDGGPTYTVKALQVLQGEYLRGYTADPDGSAIPGRRIKATAVPAVPGVTETPAGLPEGSATVAADGSVAALVPAKRATSWQLLGHDDSPVVRERYWLSFQAGEIRSCTSCHGVNTTDQTGASVATNPPAALRSLLETVKQSAPQISETSTFRIWSEAALGVSLNAVEDDDADGTANMIEWGMGSSPVSAAEKPAKPLSVSLVKNAGGSFASVSFSRSTTEPHSAVIVEGSSDMTAWRTVASFGQITAVFPDYMLSRLANSGGKSENITLISTVAAGQSQDRYYRLRVTAQ